MPSWNLSNEAKMINDKDAEINALSNREAWEQATAGLSGTDAEKIVTLMTQLVMASRSEGFWFLYERENQQRKFGQWVTHSQYRSFRSRTLKGSFARAALWSAWYNEQVKKYDR